MPRRDWRERLQDILQAADRLLRYTRGMTAGDLARDELVLDAVVRNFEIIGEAARNTPPDVQVRYADVPWQEMWRTRNRVAHGYFDVDAEVLWEAIQNDLPPLVRAIQAVLDQEQ